VNLMLAAEANETCKGTGEKRAVRKAHSPGSQVGFQSVGVNVLEKLHGDERHPALPGVSARPA
jgi:hypothetical protein